ncbi:MAG: UDP-3-O-acyl-N-acetylglucosamine deacetylase [Alphaproteobacteria bacterium]|nr:UDP-3-O-acyl-N-acetylglucosamine deacetylase [Alphaproteobacteria bacterium]MBN2674953.1 UDP-3-O-acyl-N-acetylglucosamine deacetylase [Alphaproteobacteria bacterium]
MATFKEEIKISGVGIHSGKPVNIKIKPSDKYGIFFRRVDIENSELIPATWDNVGETKFRNTTIGKLNGAHVQTIEHLMAALFIVGIDSAVIEIDGPETPILDGSAKEFGKIFSKYKTVGSDLYKIIVKKEIIAKQSDVIKTLPFLVRVKIFLFNLINRKKPDGFVKLSPDSRGLYVLATLVYKEKIIGTQSAEILFDGTKKSYKEFEEEFANSRTFGKFSEWEYLKARGMARGASEENVIALNKYCDGTINPLYRPDEFVRHKIIDVLGDMFTSGGFIYGKLESYKGSHALNNIVLKKLFSDTSNYDIIKKSTQRD